MSNETIGMLLGALGLLVGLAHVIEIIRVKREAKSQAIQMTAHTSALNTHTSSLDLITKSLNTHTQTLDRIIGSLSTRLLGRFPDYYEKIAELISEAEESIVVFSDSLAYGSFTRRSLWEFRYHYNLKRQLVEHGRKLEVTCLDEHGRRESVKSQFFGSGKTLKMLKEDPAFAENLKVLLSQHRNAPKFDEVSENEFQDILESEEKSALEDLPGATIHEIKADMPLYFWLIDSGSTHARAIFAIPSFSERIVEYGFTTTDQELISAFEQMRDRYHKPLQERQPGDSNQTTSVDAQTL